MDSFGSDTIKNWKTSPPAVAALYSAALHRAGEANAGATAKVQRGILVDCLTGSNGRAKIEGWLPRWFAFPPSAYTERGGVGCVKRSEGIAFLLAPVEVDAEPEMRHAG